MNKIVYILLISFLVLVILFFFFGKQIPSASEKITVAICSLRGGSMIESGCGIARCTYKCVVPYRDGGRECSNSDHCSHRCVVVDSRLPTPFSEKGTQKQIASGMAKLEQCTRTTENIYDCNVLKLSGTCEQREQKNCEDRWELNDGVISPIFADCTL